MRRDGWTMERVAGPPRPHREAGWGDGGRGNDVVSVPYTPHNGFTLVELLVVIAILGILISLVTAGAQAARRKAAVTKAKVMIENLTMEIGRYENDMGEYPKTGNDELVKALQEDPKNPSWDGPYMELKQADLKDGKLIDPWGNPYVYVSVNGGSPEHRERSFDVYSLGPNGADDHGAGDDIYNW